MDGKAYRVYNKRTQLIEESIHIVLDESNDGNIRSSPFQELKLSRYDDDEEEEEEARAICSRDTRKARNIKRHFMTCLLPMMSHKQSMKMTLPQMLKMKATLMSKDEAANTSHIIPLKPC